MLKLKTNKLYYGKFPYKIGLESRGASLLSVYGIKRLLVLLRTRRVPAWANCDETSLHAVVSHVVDIPNPIKTRVEGSCLNVYFQEQIDYDKFIKRFEPFIVLCSEPENEQELKFLQENTKKVICNKLPRNKFKYKAFFKMMPVKDGDTLVKWADVNSKVFLNKGPRHSLTLRTFPNAYLLVEDKPTLTMLSLIAGTYISRIEEYVVRTEV